MNFNFQKKLSAIQWTDITHNFWYGCHKISEGCKFCYMYRDFIANGSNPRDVKLIRSERFFEPYYITEPRYIFTCSYSDFFIENADDWRDDAWSVIKSTPQHTWQILTKRPERIMDHLPEDWGDGYPNVWLGVSVENMANMHRLQTLKQVPAALRFISAEPLLEYINFLSMENVAEVHSAFKWMILGGESGNEIGDYTYRPSSVEWYSKIVTDIHSNTDMALFVKQMGTHLAKQGVGSIVDSMGVPFDKKGGDIRFFPDELKIRQMPLF